MLVEYTGESGESRSLWQWKLGGLVGKPSCLVVLSSTPSGPIVTYVRSLHLDTKHYCQWFSVTEFCRRNDMRLSK